MRYTQYIQSHKCWLGSNRHTSRRDAYLHIPTRTSVKLHNRTKNLVRRAKTKTKGTTRRSKCGITLIMVIIAPTAMNMKFHQSCADLIIKRSTQSTSLVNLFNILPVGVVQNHVIVAWRTDRNIELWSSCEDRSMAMVNSSVRANTNPE